MLDKWGWILKWTLFQKEACIFSHRMAGQYKSGIPLFLSGAPITSLSDRNRLVFRTSEEEGMWGGVEMFGGMNQIHELS